MKSTQTFYLPEAVNLISQNLGYQCPIESLYHEAEQGRIAIGFINIDRDHQLVYFLDIENIQEMYSADKNKAECTTLLMFRKRPAITPCSLISSYVEATLLSDWPSA